MGPSLGSFTLALCLAALCVLAIAATLGLDSRRPWSLAAGVVRAEARAVVQLLVVAAALAGLALVGLARARLGGFTGDVLGASIVVSETVGLVVLGASW